jgi:hypothetical protein
VSFNGTSNITVADATKLPLAGGTMTGAISFAAGQTFPGTGDVTLNGSQTLTNKTIAFANNTLTGVQPSLVSGTNIKTVNGTSLLGSGNVEAGGGGQYSAIASGAIASAGLVVSLNADGTVSTTTGNDASVTSPTAFTTVYIAIPVSAYDPVNKKVVVMYNNGSTGFPEAIVGTVTGTAISFGSSVVVTSVISGEYSIVFDVTNSKFVVFYRGTSNHGYAKVGTVSGTTISFGAEATFNAATSSLMSSAYDTVNSKILLSFQDGFSTTARSLVATVSGTSVSFGSSVANPSGSATRITTTYHTAQGRFVVAFQRSNDSNKGWAVVVTISGTTPSFGTAVKFHDASTGVGLASTYDPVNQNVIIAHGNNGLSTVALCAVVSGTVITYGAPVTVNAAYGANHQLAYDPNVNRAVLVYLDGTVNLGVSNTLRVSGTTISASSNLNFTSTGISSPSILYLAEALKPAVFYALNSTNRANWLLYTPFASTNHTRIGVAQSSAANGAAVTVKVQGGVDENQSGLTIGSTYYVASDGALTTTVSSNNPRIGLALKANTLLITDSI